MKKIMAILITLGMLISPATALEVDIIEMQINNKEYKINGQKHTTDVTPIIINGNTYLPVRAIIEMLGGEMKYDPTTKFTLGIIDRTFINFYVPGAQSGPPPTDQTEQIHLNAIIKDRRTLAPLRALTDSIGATIDWEPITKKITIHRQAAKTTVKYGEKAFLDSTGPNGEFVPMEYYLPGDKDFVNGTYIGDETSISIPIMINGQKVTSYENMFAESLVMDVINSDPSITNLKGMFKNSKAGSLNLRELVIDNALELESMFEDTNFFSIDMRNIKTSGNTNIEKMFKNSHAKTIWAGKMDMNNFKGNPYMDYIYNIK